MSERLKGALGEENRPLVSVLVPSYNHERYIGACLQSIANLSYPRLELIVSDDCSKDNTLVLARQWAQEHTSRFERVSVIPQEQNLGIARNYRFLIEQARGKYIAALASDDMFVASAIEERVALFERYPEVDGVFGNAQIVSEAGDLLQDRACPTWLAKQLSLQSLLVAVLLLHWGNMPGPVLMLRRAATAEQGSLGVLPGNLLAEDKYIFLRLASQGKLRFVNSVVAQYRMVQGSLSRPYPGSDVNLRGNIQCDRMIRPMLCGFSRNAIDNRIARNMLEIEKKRVRFYHTRLFFVRCWTFGLRSTLRVCALLAPRSPHERLPVNENMLPESEDEGVVAETPLITILITTKDRHEELERTLVDLRRQTYTNVELVAIDDASKTPIEPLVLATWPEARVIRHEENRGINVRRNEGVRLARGEFILSVDDDSSLVDEQSISLSVAYMRATPRCAAIAYYVWNGKVVPEDLDRSRAKAGNCLSFPGCGAFLRKKAIAETGLFREIYVTQGEETELSLQLLKKGWNVSFRPEILTHHRFSPLNRNNGKAWKHSLRNGIWTSLIHMPAHRLPIDLIGKIATGCWDAFRLLRGKLFMQALWEAVCGARQVLRFRQPLSEIDMRRFDALRAYGVLPYEMFADPPQERWKTLARLVKRWRSRLREGAFYSKRRNAGRGNFPTHEHELQR